MYSDIAYITEKNNLSDPLFIKSCGYYRLYTLEQTSSERPTGRSDYQLLYVASGKTHFFFEGRDVVLSEGTFVLYRPGQPQKYVYYAKDKPEVFWCHFSGNEVEEILERYGLKSQTILHTTPSEDLKNLFFVLIHESQNPSSNYKRLSALLLRSIFLYASKNTSSEHITADPSLSEQNFNPQDIISKACRYFNTHYMEDINIEKYALDNHMSPCWFIRCFKKHIGTTPKQHIISARITYAQSMLENTELSISKIASSVGYEDSRYFDRIFKKQTGISPLEYRKSRT